MKQMTLVEDYVKRLVEAFTTITEEEQQRIKDGFKPYRKTSITWAKQMDEPFTCDTLEGDEIRGKAGDYLCIGGAKGEQWPVDKEVFESTYQEVE